MHMGLTSNWYAGNHNFLPTTLVPILHVGFSSSNATFCRSGTHSEIQKEKMCLSNPRLEHTPLKLRFVPDNVASATDS